MFEKPSADLEALLSKRASLLAELTSDQHYSETPTVIYGDHNPFDVDLARCDSCGAQASTCRTSTENGKGKWSASCSGCLKEITQHQRDQWLAALMWNGINLGTQSYRDLPLFGLTELNPGQAGEKISAVRRNLVLRVNLCNVERALANAQPGRSQPGRKFQLRLEAYLQWAMLAHRLIKYAKARTKNSDQVR